MFKNVAAKFMVFAFDSTTNLPKTGDAANITAYVSKDYGSVTVLADTAATEMDATNAKGYYLFDAAQGETNGDCLMVSAKSATANIVVIGAPSVIYTRPTTGWLAPTTAARTLDVSAGGEAGIDWANVGSPTTTLGLSGTTVKEVTDVETTLGTIAGYIDTEVAAIKTKTDFLPSVTAGAAGGLFIAGTNAATTITTALTTTFTGNLTGTVASVTGAVGSIATGGIAAASFAAGAIDASSIAADAITASKIATGAIDADALATDAVSEIADGILDRNMTTGTDSGSATVRTSRQALRSLRNKVSIAAGTLTVTKEDDATASWTAAVATTAGDPISSIDPAGP